jgi:hypothetical protein
MAHTGQSKVDVFLFETRGPDGSPPFLVRWAGDGRTTLVFPGPDARVHSLANAES